MRIGLCFFSRSPSDPYMPTFTSCQPQAKTGRFTAAPDEEMDPAPHKITTVRFACLTYHVLGERSENQYQVSKDGFCNQLGHLKAAGYSVENLDQLEKRLRDHAPFPDRYVVVTLDDGHRSGIYAAEALFSAGCNATFCVVRQKSQHRSGYLREAQIRDLRRSGFSIASHGVTHGRLTQMTRSRCIQELRDSKAWLEDLLGEEVRHFAAPGGYFNARVTQLAFEEGYMLFGTCVEAMNSTDRLTLPAVLNRVNVRSHFPMSTFQSILEGDPLFYWRRRVRGAVLAIPKFLSRGDD